MWPRVDLSEKDIADSEDEADEADPRDEAFLMIGWCIIDNKLFLSTFFFPHSLFI